MVSPVKKAIKMSLTGKIKDFRLKPELVTELKARFK